MHEIDVFYWSHTSDKTSRRKSEEVIKALVEIKFWLKTHTHNESKIMQVFPKEPST